MCKLIIRVPNANQIQAISERPSLELNIWKLNLFAEAGIKLFEYLFKIILQRLDLSSVLYKLGTHNRENLCLFYLK